MAHYYGTLQGHRGEATRCGTRRSGLEVCAASWKGAVKVQLYDRDGEDYAVIRLTRWHGVGVERTLYDGPIGALQFADSLFEAVA